MEPTNRTASFFAPLARALVALAPVLVALAAPGVAQVPVVEGLLWTPADAQPGDEFGYEVVADGDRVAISERGGDTTRVLVRSGGAWVQEFETTGASDVALSGDLLAVGGSVGLSLNVTIYERGASGWQPVFQVPSVPAGTLTGDLALHGERLLVGLSFDSTLGLQTGKALLYERLAGTWTLTQELFPLTADPQQRFGKPLAIGDDFLVVGAMGAPWTTHRAGEAHVFELQGSTWVPTVRLRNPNAQTSTLFPSSIAIDGERVLLGHSGSDLSGELAGAAHLYERTAGPWTYLESFLPADPGGVVHWGFTVDMLPGRILIGSRYQHRAMTWTEGANGWEPEALLFPGGTWSNADGPFVALGDDFAVIGDKEDDHAQLDGGCLRFYDLPPVAFGSIACAGGASLPCPCGNAPGDASASGCRNTSGEGARLVASGGDSLAADDLVLSVHGLPADEFLILWAAPGPAVPLPADGGVGCLGPGAVFLQHGPTSLQSFGPGLGTTLGALPGETWFFQVAYRDHLGGPCALVNWSSALGATFTP